MIHTHTHTHKGIPFSPEQDANLLWGQRRPQGIMLSEINQIEKDKYCMVSLMCGINKLKIKKKKSETYRNRM